MINVSISFSHDSQPGAPITAEAADALVDVVCSTLRIFASQGALAQDRDLTIEKLLLALDVSDEMIADFLDLITPTELELALFEGQPQ